MSLFLLIVPFIIGILTVLMLLIAIVSGTWEVRDKNITELTVPDWVQLNAFTFGS